MTERRTAAEAMAAVIGRRLLTEGIETAFQGFASPLPTVAIRLARELGGEGAPTHLSASGSVNGQPERMPRSTESARLLEGSEAHFSSPEAFDMAARGDLDVMFVGSPQIDRAGRLNASGIGPLDDPKIRFPGAGGSGSLLPLVDEGWAWRTEHSPRTLPESVEHRTAVGNLTFLVTPLCTFEYTDGELLANGLLPGVDKETVRERTGWEVNFADPVRHDPPTDTEVQVLERIDPDRVRRLGFAESDSTHRQGGRP